jgi:AcrR family transcriptional regulator
MTPRPSAGSLPASKRLPAGRHGLPAEVVREHQRRRLIAAMAEICAESSYDAAVVGDVATRASVSRKTFYEFFESKEACLLAAHGAVFAGLLGTIDSACREAELWEERVAAALRSALAFLAADLAGAQLLSYGIVSAGRNGAERYHEMIETLATQLREGAPAPPAAPGGPYSEWAAVVFACSMVGKAAMGGDAAAIRALEGDLLPMLLPQGGN